MLPDVRQATTKPVITGAVAAGTLIHTDEYAIYATAFDSTASWTGVYIGFSDWSDLGSATQTWLGSRATVAPIECANANTGGGQSGSTTSCKNVLRSMS